MSSKERNGKLASCDSTPGLSTLNLVILLVGGTPCVALDELGSVQEAGTLIGDLSQLTLAGVRTAATKSMTRKSMFKVLEKSIRYKVGTQRLILIRTLLEARSTLKIG